MLLDLILGNKLKIKESRKNSFSEISKRKSDLNPKSLSNLNLQQVLYDEKKINNLIESLLSFYKKCQYKKIITITNKVKLNFESLNYWKVHYIKLLALIGKFEKNMENNISDKNLKIVKLKKYYNKFINEYFDSMEKLGKILGIEKKIVKKRYKEKNVINRNLRKRKTINMKGNSISQIKKTVLSRSSENIFKNKDNLDIIEENTNNSGINMAKNNVNNKIIVKSNDSLLKKINEIKEIYLSSLLNIIYLMSDFCINEGYIYDGIAYLSMGEKLIKECSFFFLLPNTYFYSTKIFLLLSSLCIISENYDTAREYSKLSFRLSYKELELRINNSEKRILFDFNKLDEREKLSINNIILNISIAFYHLGVCNENEYDCFNAWLSYRQSKWFSKCLCSNKNNPEESICVWKQDSEIGIKSFQLFLSSLLEKENIRQQLLEFFDNMEEPPKIKKKEKNNKFKYFFDENDRYKKYEPLQQYLENLKLREIDDEEPTLLNNVNAKPFSLRVGIPTKNVHILNYMLNSKFNPLVETLDKIELNALSKETSSKIQKQIIEIKKEELFKIYQKTEKKKEKNMSSEIKRKKEREKTFSPKNNFFFLKVINNILNKGNIYENNDTNILIMDNKKSKSFVESDSKICEKINSWVYFEPNDVINNNKMKIDFKKYNDKETFYKYKTSKNIKKNNVFDNEKEALNKRIKRTNLFNIRNNKTQVRPSLNKVIKNTNASENKYLSKKIEKENNSKVLLTNISNVSKQSPLPKLNISRTNEMNNTFFSKYYIQTQTDQSSMVSKITNKKKSVIGNHGNISRISINSSASIGKAITNSKKLNDNINKTQISGSTQYKNMRMNTHGNSFSKNRLNKHVKLDKYVFSKNFKNKRNFLEQQYTRELSFQKQLLYTKSKEINNYEQVPAFNLIKVNNDCDNFYFKNLNEKIESNNKEKVKLNNALSKKKENSKDKITFQRACQFISKNNRLMKQIIKQTMKLIPKKHNQHIFDQLTSDINDIGIKEIKLYKKRSKLILEEDI